MGAGSKEDFGLKYLYLPVSQSPSLPVSSSPRLLVSPLPAPRSHLDLDVNRRLN